MSSTIYHLFFISTLITRPKYITIFYSRVEYQHYCERVIGIEPTSPAWKAGVLPLNYTRRVGREGFEPPKAYAGRFTVCSLWPLGHLPRNTLQVKKPAKLRATERTRTSDRLITNQLLYQLSYGGNSLKNLSINF